MWPRKKRIVYAYNYFNYYTVSQTKANTIHPLTMYTHIYIPIAVNRRFTLKPNIVDQLWAKNTFAYYARHVYTHTHTPYTTPMAIDGQVISAWRPASSHSAQHSLTLAASPNEPMNANTCDMLAIFIDSNALRQYTSAQWLRGGGTQKKYSRAKEKDRNDNQVVLMSRPGGQSIR